MSITSGHVLITGATGGIGQAIARAFADRGARLTLSGRATRCSSRSRPNWARERSRCDLGDRADVERLIAESGVVDVLVANAALPATGSSPS